MKKVLVANRGEIALRVMRSLRKMGIESVAVYSEADVNSPFVSFADYAFCIGPPASAESYLRGDHIIEVAKQNNCDGIHPGYGFLSENAGFAEAVTQAGIKFIGPSPHSIRIMGSKLDAKDAVKNYDIPMVPGTDTAITDIPEAKKIAGGIGYPILIKASAGGGGKGMRIVESDDEFVSQMERAISEAESAFGDGSVFIEKYVTSPRHIEIQVLCDAHGNAIHLFERECSVQRRHQKVVEEAPSTVVNADLRARMGEAAIKVAKSCNYEGVGTVEFLLDGDKNFYFLEMNTRLQVEHPVTEMISGVDLVEQQIKVARGEKLSIQQEDLSINGHALELRVYAEDPENNFLPSIGTMDRYEIPSGEGIRVDDSFTQGMQIPIYYDPMIAKLIVHAPTRELAIQKMRHAIRSYNITGIKTTLGFGDFVMESDAFISGDYDTHFVKKYFSKENIEEKETAEGRIAAAFAQILWEQETAKLRVPESKHSHWSNQTRTVS